MPSSQTRGKTRATQPIDVAGLTKPTSAVAVSRPIKLKRGYYRCMVCRKRCNEEPKAPGECKACTHLRLQRRGFSDKHSDHSKERHNLALSHGEINDIVAQHGIIGWSSGTPRSDATFFSPNITTELLQKILSLETSGDPLSVTPAAQGHHDERLDRLVMATAPTVSKAAAFSTQQCLTKPQLALDQSIAQESNVRHTLAACGIPGGEYIIQVGFNADMILEGIGALQEIYIYTNFELPSHGSSVLHRLGKILSPFPSKLITPEKLHDVPILSEDGSPMTESDFWVTVKDRKIFQPMCTYGEELSDAETDLQDEDIRLDRGSDQAQLSDDRSTGDRLSGEMVGSCGDAIQGDTSFHERRRHGSSFRDDNGSPSRGGDECSGGGGSPGRGSPGGSSSTGSGCGGSSGRGGGGSPGRRSSGGSPGNGGRRDGSSGRRGDGSPGRRPQGDGDGDPGSDDPDPGSDAGGSSRKSDTVKLELPLSAITDIEWGQAHVSQRLSVNSRTDITVCEDGDFEWAGASFEVDISRFQVDTQPTTHPHYSLHSAGVRVITSKHPTTLLNWSPDSTLDAENTFKERTIKGTTFQLGVQVSKNPLCMDVTRKHQSESEEVKNRTKVTINLNAQGAPGDEVRQWHYTNLDGKAQRSGCTFQDPPRVSLGFLQPAIPHLEIEFLVYWSMLAQNTSRRAGFPRFFSRSKGTNGASAPPFVNLLQQVSISIPLERLRDNCWFFGPKVEAKTHGPLVGQGLQCKALREEWVQSKGNFVDLKVGFGCGLHGQVSKHKELTEDSPPQPLLRSLPRNSSESKMAGIETPGSSREHLSSPPCYPEPTVSSPAHDAASQDPVFVLQDEILPPTHLHPTPSIFTPHKSSNGTVFADGEHKPSRDTVSNDRMPRRTKRRRLGIRSGTQSENSENFFGNPSPNYSAFLVDKNLSSRNAISSGGMLMPRDQNVAFSRHASNPIPDEQPDPFHHYYDDQFMDVD